MILVRRLARPMVGIPFVVLGVRAFRDPGPRADQAAKVGPKLAKPLHLPDDPETLVRINAGAQVAAGAMLSLGRFPRLSALVLAGSLGPTTVAGHSFWEETDKQAKARQQTQFLKNLAMFGGLIFVALDRGGRPSLRRKAKKAARRTAARASGAAESAGRAAERVREALPVGA